MTTVTRCAPFALAVALFGALAAPASAKPPRGPGPELHDPFVERDRFTLKNLQLEGRGPSIVLARGGRVQGTVELEQSCRDCGASTNQIIVGLAGEPSAQACIYSGGGRSMGWRTASFELVVPDRPGSYEIRARYAQAFNCEEALVWWRTDRPNGPGPASTIGLVVVDPAIGQPVPVVPGPPPITSPRRALRELRRDLDATLAQVDDLQAQILELSARPASARRTRTINDLARRAAAAMRDVRALQSEIFERMADMRDDRHDRPGPDRPDRPGPDRPDRFDRPAPPPVPLTSAETRELTARMDRAAFPDAKRNALLDAIQAGAWFTTQSAIEVLAQFPHESDKVEIGALLCPRIVELGALPRLLDTFVFESYRNELRSRTGGQCGPPTR